MNKLHQLQTKIGIITKDTNNDFYNSKYFDINKLIEILKPILIELGLMITQPIEVVDGRNRLITIIKEIEGDDLAKSSIILPDIPEPQKIGSAITYYRRYSLQSMLFLQAEDDDVNKTVPQNNQKTSPPAHTAPNPQGIICDSCKSSNVKHLKGTSKKTNKPYDFYSCQDCNFAMNF